MPGLVAQWSAKAAVWAFRRRRSWHIWHTAGALVLLAMNACGGVTVAGSPGEATHVDAGRGGAAGQRNRDAGAPAADDAGPEPVTAKTCSKDGWCWSNPLPQGNDLLAVWGTGDNDVWAVGGGGTILHFDGHAWASVESGVDGPLTSVWADSPADAWAAGPLSLLHWDGKAWASVDTGVSAWWNAVWGSGADDVWVVGDDGTVVHFDGTAWTELPFPAAPGLWNVFDLDSVWGSGPNDVWIGDGVLGDAVHWDGSKLAMAHQVAYGVSGFSGTGPDDAWAASSSGRVAHFDGSVWTVLETGAQRDLNAIQAVFGSNGAAGDVWAVGDAGTIVHFHGGVWSTEKADGTSQKLNGVWADSAGNAWAVGAAGMLLHYSHGSWSRSGTGSTRQLFGVSGTGPDDVWAVGAGGAVLHYDGGAWKSVASGTSFDINGVWAHAPNDAWLVADSGEIRHYDGNAWTDAGSGTSLRLMDIWGSGADDVWAVGWSGAIEHFDGSVWSPVPSWVDANLDAVYGTSAHDVWAVGGTSVVHFDGTGWTPVDYGLDIGTEALDDVWSGGGEVWSVGEYNGTVLHLANGKWSNEGSQTVQGFDVWGAGVDDVWLAGGQFEHWNGTTWTSGTGNYSFINALWGSGPNDVWAVGDSGAILHYSGGG